MLDWLCDNWDQPDEGIWETRGGRRPFMYGRLMSWVAFDRAIRMAAERVPARPTCRGGRRSGTGCTAPSWIRAGTPSMKAFVQYEGSDVLDASTLLMPRRRHRRSDATRSG